MTGPSLNLPKDISKSNLELLLNQLLKQEDGRFAFFVNDQEIVDGLQQDILDKQKLTTEDVLKITYVPQASFKVSPVTRCSSTLSGHTESILQVKFSPCGTRVASASGDCTVRVWELSTETPRFTLSGHTNWVMCLAWSPCGTYLVSGSMDNQVIVWNAVTGKMHGAPLKGHTKYVTGLAWEPYHLNGGKCERLVSSSRDGTARVWNVRLHKCEQIMSSHTDAVTACVWSGESLIYTTSRDKSIKVWDAQGKLCRILVGHAHWINCMALSTDAVLKQGMFGDGSVKLSVEEARQRYETARGASERLVTGSDDYTMFLWQPATDKRPVCRMTGHQQLVNHVAFTPDGRMIASGSFDKSIKLWQGYTGEYLTSLRSHVASVYQVCFSADSRYLLSGSKDSTLKLWDLKTRKLKADLPGHADEVFTVDWAPDRSGRVVSGGRDRMIKFWR